MIQADIGLVLTPVMYANLGSIIELFMQRPLAGRSDTAALLCESVDLSGYLIEAVVISKDGEHTTSLWFPQSGVLFAVDLRAPNTIGFI